MGIPEFLYEMLCSTTTCWNNSIIVKKNFLVLKNILSLCCRLVCNGAVDIDENLQVHWNLLLLRNHWFCLRTVNVIENSWLFVFAYFCSIYFGTLFLKNVHFVSDLLNVSKNISVNTGYVRPHPKIPTYIKILYTLRARVF